MEKLELIKKDENNLPMLSDIVDDILNVCEEDYEKACSQYDAAKDELLKAMIDNGLKKAETKNFKISCRENKSTWTFNEEAFKSNESPELVAAFTKTEKVRNSHLDVDKLMQEYPEVYAKCLVVEEQETTSIDVEKLWKTLENIWKKYATEVKPEKLGTVKIVRKE